jgi:hypothetical protein
MLFSKIIPAYLTRTETEHQQRCWVGVSVARQTCVCERSRSNLGRDHYPYWDIHDFPQFLQSSSTTEDRLRHESFLRNPFQFIIHQSSDGSRLRGPHFRQRRKISIKESIVAYNNTNHYTLSLERHSSCTQKSRPLWKYKALKMLPRLQFSYVYFICTRRSSASCRRNSTTGDTKQTFVKLPPLSVTAPYRLYVKFSKWCDTLNAQT